jgi:ubiquinol-cytochrome c reductase cytochrome c subunit
VRKLSLVALVALASCGYLGPQEGTEIYRPPGLADAPEAYDGKQLYMRDCAWCHGGEGEGTRYGPDIISGTNGPASVHFMISSGRMPISSTDERVERGDSAYTPEQIDKIVEFTSTFEHEGPDVPGINPDVAGLPHGGELYLEHCAACHATTGIGGALTEQGYSPDQDETSSIVAPSLYPPTELEVAEAIRVGPGTMPVFSEGTLDDEDVDAIVRYVSYLESSGDRGGAPIGRVGPVLEGAVGWIVGLGLLLFLIRWMGTKRGEL